jgi:hypothetical protein
MLRSLGFAGFHACAWASSFCAHRFSNLSTMWRGKFDPSMIRFLRPGRHDARASTVDKWERGYCQRPGAPLVSISGLTRGQPLRWRSQFTPRPARCFPRFHRIDKLDHALMNVIASEAFECSDVKAGWAGSDPCQHRCSLALRTEWSAKRAHDAVPCIRRERDTLSRRVDARNGPVMGTVFHARGRTAEQY